MALVTETIRVVTTGANPKTQNFSVQVDTATGAGVNPLSIPLLGTNSGSDSVTAFLDSHALTSNVANVAWQAINGAIATGPVTVVTYSNNALTRGYPGLSTASSDQGRNAFPYNTPGINSLVFNQVVPNYPINGFNNQPTNIGPGGGYKLNPMVAVDQTNAGAFASKVTILGTAGNNSSGSFPGFVLDITGSFVVTTPGTYTFYMNYANVGSTALWVGGGATFSSQNAFGGNLSGGGTVLFPASSPTKGYPLAIAATNPTAVAHPNVVSSYITFPTAGVYPFEAIYNQYLSCQFSYNHNSYWQITYLQGAQNQNVGQGIGGAGFQNLPVVLVAAPPAGPNPTGALRLTPTGGAAGLKVQGQTDTLTLTIQNVPYTSIAYMPILEGTAGSLFVYNNAGATAFDFQTYNGFAVDRTAAATSDFVVTANNSAINGLFNVTAQSTHFLLNYNGGAFAFAAPGSQISSSDLTLTADDIAWFDGTAGPEFKTFDLFSPVGGAGGTAFSIAVDYMTRPTIQSVSPASLQANGVAQAVTINLSKPMSPQQQGLYGTGNTVVPSASVSGGASIGVLTPILDAAGFLQGWSANITVPISSTNGSVTLTVNVSGTLTYLSGTTFVTTTVPYIVNSQTVIPTIGNQFVPPVAVSLTVVPGNTSGGAAQTLTATIYTFDNNACTCQFQRKSTAVGAIAINIGAGVLTNSYTGIVGGKTAYYKVFTLTGFIPTAQTSANQHQLLGFVANDTVSSLSVTYFSATVYTFPLIAGGGGGGGGGCFTEAVAIETPAGLMEFGDLDEVFELINETGTHMAELVVHENYKGWMIELEPGKLVTLDHFMKDGNDWIAADDKYPSLNRVWFEGTVYNIHVITDDSRDQHFVLWNGDVAHNLKMVQ